MSFRLSGIVLSRPDEVDFKIGILANAVKDQASPDYVWANAKIIASFFLAISHLVNVGLG